MRLLSLLQLLVVTEQNRVVRYRRRTCRQDARLDSRCLLQLAIEDQQVINKHLRQNGTNTTTTMYKVDEYYSDPVSSQKICSLTINSQGGNKYFPELSGYKTEQTDR